MSRRKKRQLTEEVLYRGTALKLTRGVVWYVLLWLGALIFTQALRSTASNIFFSFVCLLPWASLAYTLVSLASLEAELSLQSDSVEKGTPLGYTLLLKNKSPLAYPFAECYLMLPEQNSVRCGIRTVKLALGPCSSSKIEGEAIFRFRGTYEIGVKCFYVYDFFRMLRLRVAVEQIADIAVMPRRLDDIREGIFPSSDSAQKVTKSPYSYEKLEVSDIRDYMMGDALKSIHWKLSSKSEDMKVREYSTGVTNVTVVYADMSRHFPEGAPKLTFEQSERLLGFDKNGMPLPPEEKADAMGEGIHRLASPELYDDMNEYCADGVVELTLATVMRELRDGKRVCLVWFDRRSKLGAYAFMIESEQSADSVLYGYFATAPIAEETQTVAKLASLLTYSGDTKQIFVLPTLDDTEYEALSALPGTPGGASSGDEVIVFDPEHRFAVPEERRIYLRRLAESLGEHGIRTGFADPNRSKSGEVTVNV